MTRSPGLPAHVAVDGRGGRVTPPDGLRRDVVVVGGGVAGLVAARELAGAGRLVTLLEAAGRLGGCVAAQDVAGLTLDVGAESFATRTPAVGTLLDELGLGGDVVRPAASGAWVRLPDRAVPLPAAGLLGIPGDPWAADVRRAVGLAGAARASLDRWLPARLGLPPGATTLADVVRARMGRRVLQRLVAPVVAGVYSTAAEACDLDTVLPGVRGLVRETGSLGAAVTRLRAAAPAGSAVASVTGGMHRLVDALMADLRTRGGEIRTGTPVERLLAPADGEGWRLTTTGSGTFTADRVLVAVPGPVAAHLLDTLVPEVQGLAGPTSDVVLVTLVVDAPALDRAPRGTGVLVADGVRGVGAKALTHATAKWAWLARATGPGRHVLRLSYGRAGERVPEPGPELVGVARRDASRLLGVSLSAAQVVGTAVTPWRGALPFARAGHRDRVESVVEAVERRPGLAVSGSWVAGTGLAAVVAHARTTASGLAER